MSFLVELPRYIWLNDTKARKERQEEEGEL